MPRRHAAFQRISRLNRGLTLIEVLVAVAVSLIIVGSVAAAFIQIIRASDESIASTNAHTASRSATDMIASELRLLELDPNINYQRMTLIDRPLIYGDGIDNDGDGFIDEDPIDGIDNDSDWDAAEDDRHAMIGTRVERPDYVGLPDTGDASVNEDIRFSADEITFIVPGTPRKQITYRIGIFDGQENVLLKDVIENPTISGTGMIDTQPVAFDVVSLDIMAWNPNNDVVSPAGSAPYWAMEWDATEKTAPSLAPLFAPSGTPPFKLPAAFFIAVTVNAEQQELADIPNWQDPDVAINVVTTHTTVTVESIANDARYFLFIRDN